MARDPESNTKVPSDVSSSSGNRSFSAAVLELEPVYQALGHPRRRYLCYSLLGATEWSLTDLATKVAAWENDIPDQDVTDDQRDKVYVSLYHTHIPKLVEEDVVTFDAASETITAGKHADQVMNALEGMGASLDTNQEAHARSDMNERTN